MRLKINYRKKKKTYKKQKTELVNKWFRVEIKMKINFIHGDK